MLRSLIRVYLKQMVFQYTRPHGAGRGQKADTQGTGLKIALFVVLMLFLMASFLVTFWSLYGIFSELESMTWVYYASASAFSALLSILSGSYFAKSVLYEGKDNELLLSMPISPRTILTARLISLIIDVALFQLVICLPCLIARCFYGNLTVSEVLLFLLSGVLLTAFCTAICSLIGYLLALLTAKLKHKTFFSTLFYVIFFMAYFYVFLVLMPNIDTDSITKESLSHLKYWIYPFYLSGKGIAETNIPYYLIYAAICLAACVLAALLIPKGFVSITTTRRTADKREYHATTLHTSSRLFALMRKECRRLFSSSIYFINSCISLILMVVVTVMVLVNGPGELASQFGMGDLSADTIGYVYSALLLILSGMTLVSANSISLEGQNIHLLHSMPIPAKTILYAKALNQFAVVCPVLLITQVIGLFVIRPSAYVIVLSLVLTQLFSLFCALMGTMWNLLFPRLDWTNEAQPVKQGISGFLAMFSGMACGIILLILGVVGAMFSHLAVTLLAECIILILLSALVAVYLQKGGARRFERLDV